MQLVGQVSSPFRLAVLGHLIYACVLQKPVVEMLRSVRLECHKFGMAKLDLRKLQVVRSDLEGGGHNLKSLWSSVCSKGQTSSWNEHHDFDMERWKGHFLAYTAVHAHARLRDGLLSHGCFVIPNYIDSLVQVGLVFVAQALVAVEEAAGMRNLHSSCVSSEMPIL